MLPKSAQSTLRSNARNTPELGLRPNCLQFSLLVIVNAFVGGMVGLERAVLPLLAEREFGLASKAAILSFIVSFGVVKAVTNLAAGGWSERVGRKPLLVAGWMESKGKVGGQNKFPRVMKKNQLEDWTTFLKSKSNGTRT